MPVYVCKVCGDDVRAEAGHESRTSIADALDDTPDFISCHERIVC
ncbi:hypothetical protein ACFY96_15180 [Streptomyces massasporeus]